MLQEELSFAIDISIDIIAFTFDLPVISAVAVSLIPESRDLLSSGDRALEIRMWVQVLLSVHVLQPDSCATLELCPRPAWCSLGGFLFLDSPQRIVVVIIVEAGDYLLSRARTVRELRWMQEETESLVPQADSWWAGQRQILDRLIYLDIQLSGYEGLPLLH